MIHKTIIIYIIFNFSFISFYSLLYRRNAINDRILVRIFFKYRNVKKKVGKKSANRLYVHLQGNSFSTDDWERLRTRFAFEKTHKNRSNQRINILFFVCRWVDKCRPEHRQTEKRIFMRWFYLFFVRFFFEGEARAEPFSVEKEFPLQIDILFIRVYLQINYLSMCS